MSPILQNLVEMTGHRDHLRLEVSVLSTLQDLSDTLEVQALEMFGLDGELHARPRTWLDKGCWVSASTLAAADPRRVAISELPELSQCLQARSGNAQATLADGKYHLWLPLWLADKVVSCLEITQDQPFSARKLDVIEGIFRVYQNYQSLLDYSERDALTGLFNRKTFDGHFARHTRDGGESLRHIDTANASGEKRGSPTANARHWLAVVDIDHFKLVNDRFGHLYGDEVLILVANILRNSFRSQDKIFRFGGEEFVVLLRSTSLEIAHQVFNRFRTAVESYLFPQVGQITVSLGFIATDTGAPVEILGQADQALYYAKEHGRNLVCYYDDLISSGQLMAKVNNNEVELF